MQFQASKRVSFVKLRARARVQSYLEIGPCCFVLSYVGAADGRLRKTKYRHSNYEQRELYCTSTV